MKLNTFYWLPIVMSALWIVLTVLFLFRASDQSSFLPHFGQIRSKDLIWHATLQTNASYTGSLYDKELYELLKAGWPPVVKPGDEGYNLTGVVINTTLLTERQKVLYKESLDKYKVDLFASDRVAMRRVIDLDMPECKNLTYDTKNLPKAGIVIIFTDEIWSALIRTVFSILDAGPDDLITEIILVDDASQKEHLGQPLDDYIRLFAGRVKLVRLPERKGLMVARNTGFEHVTGEVAVFLDGHCEVTKGWLEPLLHRIKQDDSVIAIPHHDVVKGETFQYNHDKNDNIPMCGFEFDMEFTWIPMPPLGGPKRKNLVDPVPTPTHLGCCLATSKRNFEKLGRYDPGLEIWGCENLELSFKTWMCGSRMEIIPCSHIGHMFKTYLPFKWVGRPNQYRRNCLRVGEVWMDQYKVFYEHRQNDSGPVDIGDVSERKALRQKLQCRSFDWYIKEIYPDIYIPINTTAIGRISNVGNPSLCIEKNVEWEDADRPSAKKCDPKASRQYFYLTKEKQIRRDNHCIFYNSKEHKFLSRKCKENLGTWKYSQDNLIRLEGADLCMTLLDQSSIDMVKCNSSDTRQQWNWSRKPIILSSGPS